MQVKELPNQSIYKISQAHPQAATLLSNWGLRSMIESPQFAILGQNITLEQVARIKGLDLKAILDCLEPIFGETEPQEKVRISGLLPCPVRLPLQEAFDGFLANAGIAVESDLQAASLGTDHLVEMIQRAETEDDLPDILISAGFDLFFDPAFQEKWLESGVYRFQPPFNSWNSDFTTTGLPDPKGQYGMISAVPAVFMVNKEVLGDLAPPRSWEELLSGSYKGMVSLPIEDFDLFNAILIHLEQRFGEDGIHRLKESLFDAMHPAQMVKSAEKRREARPGITVLPWFFTRTVREGSPLQAVWPAEGAIVSPIFILAKQGDARIKACADFLSSPEVGTILAHKGLFPSSHPDVENHIPDGQSFWWVGWDTIRKSNIANTLERYMKQFEKQGEMEV